MKLSATLRFSAPREKVFALLIDPEVLKKCIQGCEEMKQTGEGVYATRLKVGLAGMKGSYTGKVQLKDQEPPGAFTLVVEGKGTPGFVRGTARIELAEDDGTVVTCEAEGHVGGVIAAVGSRLVEAAAKKMMADFFKRFAAEVEGLGPEGTTPKGAPLG